MRIDSTTIIAGLLVLYGVFVVITATNLYSAGIVDQQALEVYQTTGFFISVFSLAYALYHGVYDQSKYVGSYEERDRSTDFISLLIALSAILFPSLLSQFAAPTEATLATFLVSLLGASIVLIALAENYFYIGVVADYVYDKTKNKVVSSLIAALVALAFHLSLKVAYPYYNLPALFLQFFVWTYASLINRSTFPADVAHLINNTLVLMFSGRL